MERLRCGVMQSGLCGGVSSQSSFSFSFTRNKLHIIITIIIFIGKNHKYLNISLALVNMEGAQRTTSSLIGKQMFLLFHPPAKQRRFHTSVLNAVL